MSWKKKTRDAKETFSSQRLLTSMSIASVVRSFQEAVQKIRTTFQFCCQLFVYKQVYRKFTLKHLEFFIISSAEWLNFKLKFVFISHSYHAD